MAVRGLGVWVCVCLIDLGAQNFQINLCAVWANTKRDTFMTALYSTMTA